MSRTWSAPAARRRSPATSSPTPSRRGGANDTLTGGGYDTYKLGAGMGHAVVKNLNADGVTTAMARSTSAPALPARISGSCAAATISRST